MAIRKTSKILTCDGHTAFFARLPRRRRFEFMVEGGTSTPCRGETRCRLFPGTDVFAPDICGEEYPLDWAANRA